MHLNHAEKLVDRLEKKTRKKYQYSYSLCMLFKFVVGLNRLDAVKSSFLPRNEKKNYKR